MEKIYYIVCKDSKFHVMKSGNKRATKTFLTNEEAESFIAELSAKKPAQKPTQTSTTNTQSVFISVDAKPKTFWQKLLDKLSILK